MRTQKGGSAQFVTGNLLACDFLLPVSVRVWRDEGLPLHWGRFSRNGFACFARRSQYDSLTPLITQMNNSVMWWRYEGKVNCYRSEIIITQHVGHLIVISSVSVSEDSLAANRFLCFRSLCLFFESTCAACKHLNEEVLQSKENKLMRAFGFVVWHSTELISLCALLHYILKNCYVAIKHKMPRIDFWAMQGAIKSCKFLQDMCPNNTAAGALTVVSQQLRRVWWQLRGPQWSQRLGDEVANCRVPCGSEV